MQEALEQTVTEMSEQKLQESRLEELFAMTEEIVSRMEDPQLPLEDAFAAYEQGMRMIRACNSRIDQVEKRMLVVNREGEPVEFDDAGKWEE